MGVDNEDIVADVSVIFENVGSLINFVQPMNVNEPISVTELGIEIVVNPEQPLNA